MLHDCDKRQAVEGEDDQGEIQKIAHIQGHRHPGDWLWTRLFEITDAPQVHRRHERARGSIVGDHGIVQFHRKCDETSGKLLGDLGSGSGASLFGGVCQFVQDI